MKDGVNNSTCHGAEDGLWLTNFVWQILQSLGAIPPFKFTSPSGSDAWHLTVSMSGRGGSHMVHSQNT